MTKKYIFIFLCLIANISWAQNRESGIYLTARDYKDGKLSFAFNCDSSRGKIKLHPLFGNKYLDVIIEGKKHRFHKDSIFGYRNCHSGDFRFYHADSKEYQLLENLSIIVYMSYVPIKSSTGRTVDMVPAYFFSTSLDGDIYPLTVLNLKRAFPENIRFHDLLDLAFGDGTPLSSYDTRSKMYKINALLLLSKL